MRHAARRRRRRSPSRTRTCATWSTTASSTRSTTSTSATSRAPRSTRLVRRHGLLPQPRRVLPRPPRRHAALAHRQAARTARRDRRRLPRRRAATPGLDALRLLRRLRRPGGATPGATCSTCCGGCKADGATIAAYGAAAKGSHAAQLRRASAPTSSTSSSTATCTSRACTCPASTSRSADPSALLERAARLRAAPGLELHGRDHRPAGRVPAARRPLHRARSRRPEVVVSVRRTLSPPAGCDTDVRLSFHERGGASRRNSCLLLADRGRGGRLSRAATSTSRFCRACGFMLQHRVRLRAVASTPPRYEETQALLAPLRRRSPTTLAERWVEQYDLHGRTVLEIGCGKGEFLACMCEAGAGQGIGIDPGPIPSASTERRPPTASSGSPTSTPSATSHLAADAIVCRHTLEHIQPVGEFMRIVRAVDRRPHRHVGALRAARRAPRARGDRVLGRLLRALLVLHAPARWPGCSARTGFEVTRRALDYDDQYLLLEARPSTGPGVRRAASPLEDDLDALAAAVEHFADGYREHRSTRWRGGSPPRGPRGGRTVIWGAGSKGVAFLTTLGGATRSSTPSTSTRTSTACSWRAPASRSSRRSSWSVPARAGRGHEPDLHRRDRRRAGPARADAELVAV